MLILNFVVLRCYEKANCEGERFFVIVVTGNAMIKHGEVLESLEALRTRDNFFEVSTMFLSLIDPRSSTGGAPSPGASLGYLYLIESPLLRLNSEFTVRRVYNLYLF